MVGAKQEVPMITRVKCVKEGCELKGQPRSMAAQHYTKEAPVGGPYTCPNCGELMNMVVPASLLGRRSKPQGKSADGADLSEGVL